jgi:site-specific DNA-methyltransferase (adenine-specific)|tara:strand:+ start:151 stop:801 length:651 start_codon:yes stop_codon:yes gene_type:complete
MINIFNQDSLEAMKEMSDNQFDLAIVDPPYGISINKQSQGKGGGVAKKINYTKKDWDIKPPNKKYFEELLRVSKNVIIWGANHFIENIPNANSSCWIVWDKDNGKTDFADSELAYTNFKTSVRNFKCRWSGMLQYDMKNKEQRIHPTQKPIRLYEWLLINYAKEGDKILDTHLGSGSIAIACHNLGYDLDGYELDKEYYDNALKRIKEHQSQLRLI